MFKLTILPKWVFPGTIPSVYDTESGTCIEMTAKVYNAMKELQEKTILFTEELNKTINEFETGIIKDQETFKTHIDTIMHNYISMLDEKIKLQDSEIDNAISFMKDNISDSLTTLINEMQESGEINEVILNAFNSINERIVDLENTEYTLVYEDGTENLILQKSIKEVE